MSERKTFYLCLAHMNDEAVRCIVETIKNAIQ